MDNLSKSDLVREIAERLDFQQNEVSPVINEMLDIVTQQLENGGKVTLTGFGVFETRERKERAGVKPGTTEKIQIPAATYPAFKAGKALKEAVNR